LKNILPMELTLNPFKRHPIDLCCSSDELRPFINYIYFVNGIAYATDAHVCVALSLKDFDVEEKLIACLEGRKMSREDFKFMCEYEWLYPQENGKLFLNSEGTRVLNLKTLDDDDSEKKYQKIFDIYELAKSDRISKAVALNKIKINLHLLERLSKTVGNLNSARFIFLKELPRVFIEFEFHKNSFALVMPMLDDDVK